MRANIDHIAITRTGIYAIDAKKYAGKVQCVDKGGWFSTDWRLYVGRRDCTKLVLGMAKQVDAIRTAMGQPLIEEFDLKVHPALCFVDSEWGLFARPFEIKGVWVGWSNALGERLQSEGSSRSILRRSRSGSRKRFHRRKSRIFCVSRARPDDRCDGVPVSLEKPAEGELDRLFDSL
jgi:Nuclease-related domain